MNAVIADFLAQHYLNLPFVTRAAGCVSALVKPGKLKGVERRVPVALRLFEETETGRGLCGRDEDYHLLTPDSDQTGVLYFEDVSGAKVVASNSRYLTWEGKLKLVLWANFKRIGDALTIGDLETSLLANTPVAVGASGGLLGATIKPTRVYPKRPSPFEVYSYDEAQTQYLSAPYDYTSIEITYTARAVRGCAQNIVLDPLLC